MGCLNMFSLSFVYVVLICIFHYFSFFSQKPDIRPRSKLAGRTIFPLEGIEATFQRNLLRDFGGRGWSKIGIRCCAVLTFARWRHDISKLACCEILPRGRNVACAICNLGSKIWRISLSDLQCREATRWTLLQICSNHFCVSQQMNQYKVDSAFDRFCVYFKLLCSKIVTFCSLCTAFCFYPFVIHLCL